MRCEVDFLASRAEYESLGEKILYTGAIDELFDYKLGPLAYRSISFEVETLDTPNYQGNAVVNYTEYEVPYTRVIEHKHFETFGDAIYQNPKTIIPKEYSTEWHVGLEPYYPVNDEKNGQLYTQYRALGEALPNYLFGGRLADYKYYDMHHVIAQALDLVDKVFA